MNILGLSYMYHDSAAALIQDGKIVAAADEERFTRRKHTVEFPKYAVRYCLKEARLKINDLDCIVFYEKPYLKFERILRTNLLSYPYSFKSFRRFLPLWLSYKLYVPQIIRDELGYKGKIFFCDHHYAHAASAFLSSPFEEAAILTVDGTGEWSTLAYGKGKGIEIKLEKDIKFPHSLGLLYSAVTAHLGFRVNWAEGSVMALAAFGKPVFREQFRKLINVKEDGSFQLNLKYFSFHYDLVMTNKNFARLICPTRGPSGKISQTHRDLAATLQAVTEKVLVKIANKIHGIYQTDNLCLAGGVGLNCVANGKILQKTPFKKIFVQPAAGDDGGALGAAQYAYVQLFKGKERFPLKTAYLGPEYSNKQIINILDSRRDVKYEILGEKELLKRVAQHIFNDKIVGWFQGRMEFGPRALGNRSILGNPLNPKTKERLNRQVKHRESFRPFAPSVCLEDCQKFFDLAQASPFMTIAAPVKENKREKIPAVVHRDGTARIQTVSVKENPLYYMLIRQFEKLSGVPMLLNTSFNLKGEPIVCTPQDALASFFESEMDVLVLGNFVVKKV